jgi:glutathione S-transferase
MDWISYHVNPVITPVFWALVRTPSNQRNPTQIAADAEKIGPQFQILEQYLADRPYVAGQTFTMGDIVAGVMVYRWYALDVKRPSLPNLEAYHARLAERPAFRTHVMQPLT